MTRLLRITILFSVGALIGCGSGQSVSDSPGAGSGSEGDCSYGPDDSCMNANALAQCQEMAGRCPGQVQVLESCPLQFACPSVSGSEGDTSVSSDGAADGDTSVSSDGAADGDTSVSSGAAACEGYSLGDACIDESNFAQCQEMAAQCPGEVQAMESCPLQFACPE